MANTIVPGYATAWGNKYVVMIDHTGPSSYNNTGTYGTSGDVINASDLGYGGIEAVLSASQSSDGLNDIVWSAPGSGVVASSVALHWFVTSTSTEVANGVSLSSKSVRLVLVCV